MPKIDKYICDCKAITAPYLIKTIRKSGAETLLDIQNLIKATTGCGRCKYLVNEMLQKELERIGNTPRQLRIDFK